MYESQAVLEAHGKLTIRVLFVMKGSFNTYIEYGYSQSVNVAKHVKQMFNEAILNAYYKLNYRKEESIFNPKTSSDTDEINKYIQEIKILSYHYSYYEDRRYSYKRENRNNKYVYVIRRDGEEHDVQKPKYLRKKELEDIKNKIL